MTYLVSTNANGEVVDLFDSNVSVEIPADAVQISNAAAQGILSHVRGMSAFSVSGGSVSLNSTRVAELDLYDAKEAKRTEIRAAFDSESKKPVSVLGVSWHGGYESAVKLDAAYRLAERLVVQPSFSDTENVLHALSLPDANTIVIAVASKYQSDFVKKQQLMTSIKSATTIAAVDAITWL